MLDITILEIVSPPHFPQSQTPHLLQFARICIFLHMLRGNEIKAAVVNKVSVYFSQCTA